MADPELEAIRNARMKQMQGQQVRHSFQHQAMAHRGHILPFQDPKEAEERMEQQQQMKNSMLVQILDQNARARLNTLKISKPEKAEMVRFWFQVLSWMFQ